MATLILVGPTASGKTGVAHELARRHGAFILSADAMMVYRGMNIGTAKPTDDERKEFSYQGIDLVDPDQPWSVHDYARALTPPWSSLVVGGTGLYVRALLQGLKASPGENAVLRAEAESIFTRDGFDALRVWCLERVPELEHELPVGDRANPRRWIRAVERAAGGGEELAPRYAADACVIVGLLRAREDLSARIEKRIRGMMADGWVDEVRDLLHRYPALSPTAAKAIGYAEMIAMLRGELTLTAATEQIVIRTRQYAKRQMTWFRHQLPTRWVEVKPGDSPATTAEQVERLWHG